jgi:hypothetical protein
MLQGCGLYNYHKANKLKEELVKEQKRNTRLIKKRDAECLKLEGMKDSIIVYRNYFNTKKP